MTVILLTVNRINYSDISIRGLTMNDPKPGRGSDQFPLRFPDGMRERIKQRADQNSRSMNAEMIDMLSNALDGRWDELVALSRQLEQAKAESASLKNDLAALKETVLDKQQIIDLQDRALVDERRKTQKLGIDHEHVLWEIVANAGEVPDQLVLMADIQLLKYEGDPEWELSSAEEHALSDPFSDSAKAVISRRVERVRGRYEKAMRDWSQISKRLSKSKEK